MNRPPHSELPSIPLNAIDTPGAYLCRWNGFLLRVLPQCLRAGAGAFNLVGGEPLFVTKLSDDPELPVRAAREAAHRQQLVTSF